MSPRISRRQLALGSAWSAPAIFMAAGAPAIAASAQAIVVPMTTSHWAVSVAGSPTSASSPGYGWSTSPPYFNVDGDPRARSTFKVTITTTIPVIAGKTYTFDIGYTLTAWNPLDATGWASVNGAALSPTISTAGLTAVRPNRTDGEVSVTYTATTTGTISFGLTMQITSTSSTVVGDDIRWTSLTYTSN